MPEVSFEGQKANYLYRYFPREEPIPADWVKTWRPCMECASAVTYIDSEKVWHCMKCGWRSDMGKKYSEDEIKTIIDGLAGGKKIKDIAEELGRDYPSVCQKVHGMRVSGLLGRQIEPKAPAKPPEEGFHLKHELKPAYPSDPVGTALQEARKLGFELVSLCVNKPTATFVFTLEIGA